MSENFSFSSDDMEDISSVSKEYIQKNTVPDSIYGKGMFKHLGGIIKAIAFMISFVVLIASFVLAYFLFSKDMLFMAISLAIIIFGTFLALIVLFLIYALGHIVHQNNEILKQISKK